MTGLIHTRACSVVFECLRNGRRKRTAALVQISRRVAYAWRPRHWRERGAVSPLSLGVAAKPRSAEPPIGTEARPQLPQHSARTWQKCWYASSRASLAHTQSSHLLRLPTQFSLLMACKHAGCDAISQRLLLALEALNPRMTRPQRVLLQVRPRPAWNAHLGASCAPKWLAGG